VIGKKFVYRNKKDKRENFLPVFLSSQVLKQVKSYFKKQGSTSLGEVFCADCFSREAVMTNDFDFSGALSRLGEVLVFDGKVTQVKLAEALGIKQSSISDAKRRNSIPSDWLLKALEVSGVDPHWIRTGTGPKYRVLSDEPCGALTYTEIEKRITREQQRELTVSELMEELACRLPEGASLSINYGG